MEFKPTFFSITGFLIPGIVLVAAMALEFETSRGWLLPQITGNAAPGNIVTITIIAVALSVCFVVGSVVTELFKFFYRKIRKIECKAVCKLLGIEDKYVSVNDSTHKIAERLLNKDSKELLAGDLDAREILAYQQTGGVDLRWFEGRNLMLGGSGLSCLFAAIIAFFKSLPCGLGIFLILFGFIAMWLAAYRLVRFEEYAAKITALALLNSKLKTPTGEAAS